MTKILVYTVIKYVIHFITAWNLFPVKSGYITGVNRSRFQTTRQPPDQNPQPRQRKLDSTLLDLSGYKMYTAGKRLSCRELTEAGLPRVATIAIYILDCKRSSVRLGQILASRSRNANLIELLHRIALHYWIIGEDFSIRFVQTTYQNEI